MPTAAPLMMQPAETPHGVLTQLFGNVAACMHTNIALLQTALEKGVFNQGQGLNMLAPLAAEAGQGLNMLAPLAAAAAAPRRGVGRPRKEKPPRKERKKTVNPYLLFMASERPKVKTRLPGLSPTETMKELGALWANMDPSAKQVWVDKAASGNEDLATLGGAAAETGGGAMSTTAPPPPKELERRQDGRGAAAETGGGAMSTTAPPPPKELKRRQDGRDGGDTHEPAKEGPPLTAEEKAARKARKEAKKAKKALKESLKSTLPV